MRETYGRKSRKSRIWLAVFVILTMSLFPVPVLALTSDDFNQTNLDTTLWNFINPAGDATLMVDGADSGDAHLLISVPAGQSHDVWTGGNLAPRVMQATEDEDFSAEVKFGSGVTVPYQMQGVLVEEDSGNFIRFDFVSGTSGTRLFSAVFINGKPSVKSDQIIPGEPPLYLRVERTADTWSPYYSYDGFNWQPGTSFTHPMVVKRIGIFVGNAGSNPPAHTAVIDYFFNSESPVAFEDGVNNPDTVPPLQYDIVAVPRDTMFQLSWKTDESAQGIVEYGVTDSYELGSVVEPAFSYSHELFISGLNPDTNYYYRILSKDPSGNESYSPNFIIKTEKDPPNCNIEIWYGTQQSFGLLGVPQRWVNILGNINGCLNGIALGYSLNGGPFYPLSMGPDNYRLASSGDFNVEIANEELLTGENQLIIEAIDEFGYSFSETISIYRHHGNIWPQVYAIDWSSTDNIQDVAQVVDGLWKLEESGIHPVVLDYDRLVAIGDMTWRDYEVTVPITIHGIDPSGYSAPSYGPGVGILMRWDGHYDWGGWQPNIGWWPMGALGWYRWQGERLQIIGSKGGFMAEDTSGKKLNFGVRYLFKMRVESLPEGGSRYSLKVWPEGEAEPLSWDLMPINNSPADPGRGSFLLVAHHVDASFGNLSVTPLLPMNDGTPPEISNVKSVSGTTQATISWSTDEPATSWVSYGSTSGYEEGDAGNDVLTTLHAVTLSGLTPGAVYHYRVRSLDAAGNAATSGDLVFTTAVEGGSGGSAIVSDDFSASALDTGVWTLVDPVGGAGLAMSGTQASLSVPAGVPHDLWTSGNFAPRLMQAAVNTDFEVEVKFESAVSSKYQMQGIIVETDSDHYLRFCNYSDGSATRIFAASLWGGAATVHKSMVIPGGAPLYMRVKRSGDQWTQSYSRDGMNWSNGAAFARAMVVTGVGVYGGNAGGSNAPAHTAVIDYFFNTASPIVPEDPNGAVLLTIDITGGGSVQRNPDRASYSPGETVELTAVPDPAWSFVGWGGAASGSQSPLQLVISEDLNITATFEVEDDTTPPVLSNISSGAPAASQATISWSTDEPATTWVSYGPTAVYEDGDAGNDVLTTLHAVTLNGLTPDTEYHYRVRSVDAAGNAATSGDLVFTTVAEGGSGGSVIASDEFSASTLDTGVWTLVDPVGDAGLTMTGTQASLSVPAGVSHDLWTSGNQAPRLLQAAPDSDFEVEVKFDRMVSQKYQMQGILVEQDAQHYLRFGSYFDGAAVRLFTASLWGGTAQVRGSRVIGGSAPLYMRVKRAGSQWTHSYSFDGINWQSPHTFSFPMTVTAAGVYAGNAGASPPAFTALIDYFKNVTSAP